MFSSLNISTMKKCTLAAVIGATLLSTLASASNLDIGRAPTAEEIAGWDIDIRPDGKGLPPGEGSVADGEVIYEDKCAVCHGVFGEGEKRWPKLAGGFDTLTDDRPEKTVGSYWPYASTLWDYIHRTMPFPEPQSLSNNEVYATTAYVLYLNEIVDEDFVLTPDNLVLIAMPNAGNFYRDDRPDVINERCMENCKDPASIEVVQSLRGITPTDHFKEDGNDGVAYQEEIGKTADIPSLFEPAKAGLATYQQVCKACHDSGLAGAPKLGEKTNWKARIATGKETLYSHAINGFQGESGMMPAKGGQTQLTDDMVKQAVDYMVESSQ